MTPYSRPGIGLLTVDKAVELITKSFSLSDDKWVTSKYQLRKYVIPRQLLMTICNELMCMSITEAGKVCMKDHATMVYSRKHIHETLWNDREYGEQIRSVYKECRSIVLDQLKTKNHADRI